MLQPRERRSLITSSLSWLLNELQRERHECRSFCALWQSRAFLHRIAVFFHVSKKILLIESDCLSSYTVFFACSGSEKRIKAFIFFIYFTSKTYSYINYISKKQKIQDNFTFLYLLKFILIVQNKQKK